MSYRALDVGSGSGYLTACMGHMVRIMYCSVCVRTHARVCAYAYIRVGRMHECLHVCVNIHTHIHTYVYVDE